MRPLGWLGAFIHWDCGGDREVHKQRKYGEATRTQGRLRLMTKKEGKALAGREAPPVRKARCNEHGEPQRFF
jgi:hypothetical protein